MARTDKPRLLILEASGRVGYVALAEGPEVVGARRLDEARRHARDLAPAVAELCTAEGWRPQELHAVIVSRGPGSYTGLRVGLISAKTLAYATRCTVLAIDTFQAIAEQAPAPAILLDVLADAQQQNLYVQRWRRTEERSWLPSGPLAIHAADEWLGKVEPGVWVSGPGIGVCHTRISAANPLVDPPLRDPRPDSLLKLGLRRWQNGEADDLWGLEPLYLRRSNAEENWEKREIV
jgi:tRNA threonylcarbamoyladenosine biosynthesis protein TsaB